MTEKTRKRIVFALLPVAIIWAWFNIGPSNGKSKSDYKVPTIQPLSGIQAAMDKAGLEQIDTLALMNADWGDNPFRQKKQTYYRPTSTTKNHSWRLTGIMYNPATPMAYINKKVVKVGDMVDEARVVQIDQTAVTIEHNQKKIKLTVYKG